MGLRGENFFSPYLLHSSETCITFAVQMRARVAELVDALVSGASVQKTCRFESCPGHVGVLVQLS